MPKTPPKIEGTYELVRRELPDGTVQRAPDVVGLITFTRKYRNFNVAWKDGRGSVYSESYMAAYKLTDADYSEIPIFLMVNDEIGGQPLKREFSGRTASSPVALDGGKLRFASPSLSRRPSPSRWSSTGRG